MYVQALFSVCDNLYKEEDQTRAATCDFSWPLGVAYVLVRLSLATFCLSPRCQTINPCLQVKGLPQEVVRQAGVSSAAHATQSLGIVPANLGNKRQLPPSPETSEASFAWSPGFLHVQQQAVEAYNRRHPHSQVSSIKERREACKPCGRTDPRRVAISGDIV